MEIPRIITAQMIFLRYFPAQGISFEWISFEEVRNYHEEVAILNEELFQSIVVSLKLGFGDK